MKQAVIYHNPRCSKSRQTLALLQEHNVETTIVEYLKTPPSVNKLKTLLRKLGLSAHALIRSKETIYKELGLSKDDSQAQLIKAMADNPILIERPIVEIDDKATLGRPPEQVLSLL